MTVQDEYLWKYNYLVMPFQDKPGYFTPCDCGSRAIWKGYRNEGYGEFPLDFEICQTCLRKWVEEYSINEKGYKNVVVFTRDDHYA